MKLRRSPDKLTKVLSNSEKGALARPECQRDAAATKQFLCPLRAQEAKGEKASFIGADQGDYFVESRNPDQLIGATAIARWKFATESVTNALRKRVYYECAVWGRASRVS